MLKMPWITFLFQGLPETIASTALCFALLKRPFKWSLIIKIGVLYGITAYLVRLLPISYGVHTIILIIILATLLVHFTKCELTKAFTTSMINSIILALGEVVFAETLLYILKISFEEAYANKWLWTLLGIPQVIMLFILAFIINYLNKNKVSKVEKNG